MSSCLSFGRFLASAFNIWVAHKKETKIITNFCISHYIDLNNTIVKPGILWAAKRYFSGIVLLCIP